MVDPLKAIEIGAAALELIETGVALAKGLISPDEARERVRDILPTTEKSESQKAAEDVEAGRV